MSTLRLTTISNQSGSASVPSDTVINGSAKAWVNFNGTGTVAIRASFNVSSITDNGVGQYTINLTNAMPNANFAVGACSYVTSSTAQTGPWWNGNANTTSSFQIINYSTTGAYYDEAFMSAYIFR